MNIVYIAQFESNSSYSIVGKSNVVALKEYMDSSKIEGDVYTFDFPYLDGREFEGKTQYRQGQKEKILDTKIKNVDSFLEEVEDYRIIFHLPPMMFLKAFSYGIEGDNTYEEVVKLIQNAELVSHFSAWETDKLLDAWSTTYSEIENCHTIMVPSEWNRDVYKKTVKDKKIKSVGHVCPEPESPEEPEGMSSSFRDVMENNFVFTSVGQWIKRKSFRELITAYYAAFDDEDDVVLALKLNMPSAASGDISQETNKIKEMIGRVMSQAETPEDDPDKRPKVVVLTREFSFNEMSWLYNNTDTYVNLAKGEAFGLTVVESLMHRTPVITQRHTALREIINPSYESCIKFVDGQKDIPVNNQPYNTSMTWYSPSTRDASDKMLEAYGDWQDVEKYYSNNFDAIQESLRDRFSGKKVARNIYESLLEREERRDFYEIHSWK